MKKLIDKESWLKKKDTWDKVHWQRTLIDERSQLMQKDDMIDKESISTFDYGDA